MMDFFRASRDARLGVLKGLLGVEVLELQDMLRINEETFHVLTVWVRLGSEIVFVVLYSLYAMLSPNPEYPNTVSSILYICSTYSL